VRDRPSGRSEHRLGRRLLGALLTFLVSAAGVIGLLLFFAARDAGEVEPARRPELRGPGQRFGDQGARHLRRGERSSVRPNSSPPTSGPHVPAPVRRAETTLSRDQLLHALELGNVVLLYGDSRAPPALQTLVDGFSGPFEPALAAGGQAVILAQRPGTTGVIALAWRQRLQVPSPVDPRLSEFIEFWLGRGRA